MKEKTTSDIPIFEDSTASAVDNSNAQIATPIRQTRKRQRENYTDPHSEDELAGDNTPPAKAALKKRATPRSKAKTRDSKNVDSNDVKVDNDATTSQERDNLDEKLEDDIDSTQAS